MKPRKFMLLITLIIAAVLVSCAAEEPESVPEYESGIGEFDFMNEEFVFFTRNVEQTSGGEYMGYVQDSEFADLVRARIREVENRYNVRITTEQKNDLNNMVVSGSVAGSLDIDAVQMNSGELASLVRGGYLADLTLYSDYIDYTDSAKWGNIEMLKPLFWNNGLFGVTPAGWPMLKYGSIDGAVVVNEDIIQYLRETDPRELVEKDEWTWSKFEELMPVYSHVNDNGDNVWALYTSLHWLFRTMHTTNGEPFVVRDAGGEYQLGLHMPTTFEAMQTAWNWAFGDYSSFVSIRSSGWIDMISTFEHGLATVIIMDGSDICGTSNSIAYRMDNFGVVPFPHGPKGSVKDTGASITGTKFSTAITALSEDPVMSAVVLNDIYEPLPGYETDEKVMDYMRRFYFYDDRDVHNFMSMYENILYNYRNEGLTDVYISLTGGKSMSEWLEQFADKDEENRVKYLVNIESSIDSIFGDRRG